MNTLLAVGDVNGDGRPDVVVAGRSGRMVWLENPGPDASGPWDQHRIDEVQHMECGGSLVDLTGDGLLDVINGNDATADQIFWWQNPGRCGEAWTRHVIATTSKNQFHDTTIGNVGDGRPSLVFTNQQGGTNVCRVPLPADPTQCPWPGREVIAAARSVPKPGSDADQRQPEEGIAVGDVDGDGVNEVVSGTCWYKLVGATWEAHRFAPDTYVSTKVAIGDVDGDGRNEILLSEGDPCIYGKPQGGKLAWFRPPGDVTGMWDEHVLADGLLDAHTLRLGDVCGTGRPDILTGEIGKPDRQTGGYAQREPRVLLFENLGRGEFRPHVIDEGTGIHDAALADVWNRGVLDIVGRPLHGPEKWNVHVWRNER